VATVFAPEYEPDLAIRVQPEAGSGFSLCVQQQEFFSINSMKLLPFDRGWSEDLGTEYPTDYSAKKCRCAQHEHLLIYHDRSFRDIHPATLESASEDLMRDGARQQLFSNKLMTMKEEKSPP